MVLLPIKERSLEFRRHALPSRKPICFNLEVWSKATFLTDSCEPIQNISTDFLHLLQLFIVLNSDLFGTNMSNAFAKNAYNLMCS